MRRKTTPCEVLVFVDLEPLSTNKRKIGYQWAVVNLLARWRRSMSKKQTPASCPHSSSRHKENSAVVITSVPSSKRTQAMIELDTPALELNAPHVLHKHACSNLLTPCDKRKQVDSCLAIPKGETSQPPQILCSRSWFQDKMAS